jgi:hypothetical protein
VIKSKLNLSEPGITVKTTGKLNEQLEVAKEGKI